MPEQTQHFSDYGFDPQFDYFQVLEEARKHKRENPARSIDAQHFKLQKPISKAHHHDYSNKNNTKFYKKINGRKRWWKNALLFLRGKWATNNNTKTRPNSQDDHYLGGVGVHPIRSALSGPVYITESRSGSATPYRTTSRPSSGPLALTTMKGEMGIPYISLRDLNMDQHHRISTGSPVPIYLVT